MSERTIEFAGEKWVVSLSPVIGAISSAAGYHQPSLNRCLLKFTGPGSFSMPVPKDTDLGHLRDEELRETLERLRGAI